MKVYTENTGGMPRYAHDGDAGMDIRASEDITLKPGETKAVGTNLKIAVPKGFMIDVRPRSGLSLNTPIRVANAPGTIDSGFRGEVKVILYNSSFPFAIHNGEIKNLDDVYTLDEKGNKHGTYQIKRGDRIAQLVFMKYEEPEIHVVDDISTINGDRGGGFGHSGLK